MKVQKINESPITKDDIELYKSAISKLEGFVFNASDVNMDKRIITIRLGNVEDELTLVNPKVTKYSETPLVYYEKDTYKANKVRKTIRVPYLIIETDNLGKVEFKAEKNDWKNSDEFFGDVGLVECVLVQRAIDAIDGIDITHPTRQYSETIIKDKEPGRNERVMLQGPAGEMEFVKSKKVDSYIKDFSTITILLKALSYFGRHHNKKFINLIVTCIMIFNENINGLELYKEILKVSDEDLYYQKYEAEVEYGVEDKCENFYAELQDKISRKIDEEEQSQSSKIFKVKNNFIDMLYDYMKKYNNKSSKNKINTELGIWRYTTKFEKMESVYWEIGEDKPVNANPKFLRYVWLIDFLKLCVDTKKLIKKTFEMPSLSSLPTQSSQISWNNVTEQLANSKVKVLVSEPAKPKIEKEMYIMDDDFSDDEY